MAKRDRETLKNHFKNGRIPSQSEFGDLIESTLNILDDGFDKTPDEGFKIVQLQDGGRLLSFFRSKDLTHPVWSVRVDANTEALWISDARGEVVWAATPTHAEGKGRKGRVGINIGVPRYELDVDGTIRSSERVGVEGSVPANGDWQRITTELTGSQILEVTARVDGEENQGRYALVHTIAMNTYNPTGWWFNLLRRKNRIRCQHAYYRSRADKLRLRWEPSPNGKFDYYLQIRTNAPFEEAHRIRFHITRLMGSGPFALQEQAEAVADAPQRQETDG